MPNNIASVVYITLSLSLFLGCESCGILAPHPGIEPASPSLEGKVLPTGLPGKSLDPLSPGVPCPSSFSWEAWIEKLRLKGGVRRPAGHWGATEGA